MPWLTRNVFVQNPGDPLSEVLAAAPAKTATCSTSRRFAHIVNPYRCDPASSEARVHAMTYDSMTRARAYAGEAPAVDFISVAYSEDRDAAPEVFRQSAPLERSVQDIAAFQVPRRLPLLFDILEKGAAAADLADTLVFTNTDIALMPHFYSAIDRVLSLGYESLVINRRTIGKYGFDPALAPLMCADYGEPHRGFDCFVFPRHWTGRFLRSDACVGAAHVMRSLLFNLVAEARPLLMLKNAHLTYHLGNDRPWQTPEQSDYARFNVENAAKVLNGQLQDPERRALLAGFCTAHGEAFRVK